jgi:hypothetical protein
MSASFWKTRVAMLIRVLMLFSMGLGALLVPTLGWAQALHGMGALRPTQTIVPSASALAGTSALPTSVDLSGWTVPVGNQEQVNSCVAWAIAYDMLGWYANRSNMGQLAFAPMYMYSQINGGYDGGAFATDGFALAQNQGVDLASDYPQTIVSSYGPWPYYPFYAWQTLPSTTQQANAAHYKIGQWHTLFAGYEGAASQAAIQNALANGQPVAIGMVVRQDFYWDEFSAGYIDTDTTSAEVGSHEVLAVGYNSNGLLIQNSWGTDWGNGGFAWLSWAVVQKDVFEADVINQAFATYTVTASAGTGGTISPSGTVAVASGTTKTFTLTPNAGNGISSMGGTCGGTLSGNTYTTKAITANCTVTAVFAVQSYVITASAGAGGTISPSGAVSVASGTVKAFTIKPNAGYVIASIGGTCGGTLSGSTYTTKAITAACTVIAAFTQGTYTVTASAGAGGTISPATASVKGTATTSFTLKPNAGYVAASVGGTCGGTLSGNTFTTKTITANCTVVASFTLTYTVTISANTGGTVSPGAGTYSVTSGATKSLTITPNPNVVNNSDGTSSVVSGTCGGILSGSTYTTKAITGNCTVVVSFNKIITVRQARAGRLVGTRS